jgi:hypothetical protein
MLTNPSWAESAESAGEGGSADKRKLRPGSLGYQ